MAPAQSGLCRATRVNGQLPTLLGNPGVKFPGGLASSNFPEKVSATKGPLRASERKYLEVRVDKANEILGMVSAYYPGEAQEVIEARKTSFVPGKKSAPGSRREDCFFFETIRIPFNPRQQLLHVDIFEVQVPLQMQFEDEWVGRATLQLADPRVEEPAEYELARGPFEYGGTVTVSVKFPDPEVEAHPLPDVRDFPKPVSPREYANSKSMGTDAGGIDMSPCDIPRKGSRSSSNSTGQGKSPPQPVWVPEIKGPGGSGFGLDPKIDNIWKFNTGPVKGGTMSPLPSFPPQWFTAKLPPGTPAPRPLPPSAFQPPPVPPGLMAQIPVLATVPPAVAAMVVEALRAPPLTTATMPAPPASVLQAGPLPYLPSTPMAAQLYGGAPNLSAFVAPTVFNAPVAHGRNMCCALKRGDSRRNVRNDRSTVETLAV